MLSKIDILMIRACKSLEPEKRVRSVYRRFYYAGGIPTLWTPHIINILGRIVNDNELISVNELIKNLDPTSIYGMVNDGEEPKTYREQCLAVFISTIRHTSRERFDGLIPPTRFMRKPL